MVPPDPEHNFLSSLAPRRGVGVDFAAFLHAMPTYFTREAYRSRKQEMIIRQRLRNQKFFPERHGILGAELAAASFLVFRGAAVKFHGKDKWYTKPKEGEGTGLPTAYEEGWTLEAIDASGMELIYEGLDNLSEETASTESQQTFIIMTRSRYNIFVSYLLLL